MASVVIEVEERQGSGKNESRRLRRAGRIPAVLYGSRKPAVAVTVDPRVLEQILHSETGENTLLQLRLKGKDAQRHAMIKDYQVDPLTGIVVHADFIRIEMDTMLTVSVPVRPIGVPVGVKDQGGLLEAVHRELEVECLPGDIPEHIDVEVGALKIGGNVRVGDLVLAGKFRLLDEPGTVVFTVVAPRAEEVPVVEEAEAVAEPELITKAKKDEGGEEPAVEKKGEKKAEKKPDKKGEGGR